jgi:hypothetical protein
VVESSPITVVDGLPVATVSELLAARDRGEAVAGPYALRGYWTIRPEGFHGCGFPMEGGEPGDLELWCLDGEWGITERDEPIARVTAGGLGGSRRVPADGPHLTPFIASEEDTARLWDLPNNWGPVPIIVIGHFDDPLAEKCRASARLECLDRFVVDRIASFERDSVTAAVPEPTSTPFPIDNPPAPPFADQAWEGACYGDVEKSFAGWTRLKDLNIALNSDWDPETYVYAIVTREIVPIGDPTVTGEDTWQDSPEYPGHQIRWWGRRVCFAQEPGTLYSKSIIGSTFIEVDDGRHIEAPYPFG